MDRLLILLSVICLFVSGSCSKIDPNNCPKGYYGIDCVDQIDPKQITITKITVTNFPIKTGNGEAFDLDGSTPDILPELELYGGNKIIWTSNEHIDNPASQCCIDFIPNPAITINDPAANNGLFRFTLYDFDDGDIKQLVNFADFQLYYNSNTFPTVSHYDINGLGFTLYLSYSW